MKIYVNHPSEKDPFRTRSSRKKDQVDSIKNDVGPRRRCGSDSEEQGDAGDAMSALDFYIAAFEGQVRT